MKKQSNTLFINFGKHALANLTKEVKETIAFDLAEPIHKIFTSADLWNIQRLGKVRAQRRYL